MAIYSDKHGIFRVNLPEREQELIQFTRALKSLDIEAIHANSKASATACGKPR